MCVVGVVVRSCVCVVAWLFVCPLVGVCGCSCVCAIVCLFACVCVCVCVFVCLCGCLFAYWLSDELVYVCVVEH